MTQFIFAPTRPPHFNVRVTVKPPGDGAQEQRFTAVCKEIGQTEMDALLAEPQADMALLRAVLVDWREVVDGDGQPVPFDAEIREAMAQTPWLRYAIAKRYYQELLGGDLDRGNSAP